MIVHRINALVDNYIWVIETERHFWAVDPGESSPLFDFLAKHNKPLTGLLITHHHQDHTGGIRELFNGFPELAIYGANNSPWINRPVKQEDQIFLDEDLWLKVLETPGHTLDHLSFYNDQALFCGDTLFSGGCGRVFEGTFEQMAHSLLKIRELPDQLAVYCGHEYTLVNMRFAVTAEPSNTEARLRLREVSQLTRNKQACVPSNLAIEKATNPFLRFDLPALSVMIAAQTGGVSTNLTPELGFELLRKWKDRLDKTDQLDQIIEDIELN
jgi:hydroxyacylglutathione hydrolase